MRLPNRLICCLIPTGWLLTSCITADSPEGGTRASTAEQGELYVDLNESTKTCDGTTFLPDLHDSARPRIVEVDMQGQVV